MCLNCSLTALETFSYMGFFTGKMNSVETLFTSQNSINVMLTAEHLCSLIFSSYLLVVKHKTSLPKEFTFKSVLLK